MLLFFIIHSNIFYWLLKFYITVLQFSETINRIIIKIKYRKDWIVHQIKITVSRVVVWKSFNFVYPFPLIRFYPKHPNHLAIFQMMVDPKLQNKINYFYSSYNTDVVFGKQMSFRMEPETENGKWALKTTLFFQNQFKRIKKSKSKK